MKAARVLAALSLLAVVSACDKDKEINPPAELVDVQPRLSVKRLWSFNAGGDAPELRLALGLASDGTNLFTASHGGEVYALTLDSGRQVWRVDTKLGLSSGPGVGEGLVTVGTNDGDLVALEALDGKQRWRVKLTGEVLSAPLVTGDLVVVRTVDGRLHARAASDGSERWVFEEPLPRLTLRGNASPVRSGDAVIVGFDTGKVVAVSVASGEMLWQAQVSSPRGRTELERLADVDSAVHVAGDDVYVVGFQGRVEMLARDSGQVWWGREVSSYRGLALDDERAFVSASDGGVVAIRRRDGSILWTQEGLKYRRLSTPAVDGSAVVVGDFEGYLHWIDAATGDFVAREQPGSAPITVAPLAVNGVLYVLDDGGKLVAFRSG